MGTRGRETQDMGNTGLTILYYILYKKLINFNVLSLHLMESMSLSMSLNIITHSTIKITT